MTPKLLLDWALVVAAVLIILRVLWDLMRDPWTTLDLRDGKQQIDHGKAMGLVAFVALYALAWAYLRITRDLHWVIWSLLAVLPFGLVGVRIWFKARPTFSESVTRSIQRTEAHVRKDDERDPDWGPPA